MAPGAPSLDQLPQEPLDPRPLRERDALPAAPPATLPVASRPSSPPPQPSRVVGVPSPARDTAAAGGGRGLGRARSCCLGAVLRPSARLDLTRLGSARGAGSGSRAGGGRGRVTAAGSQRSSGKRKASLAPPPSGWCPWRDTQDPFWAGRGRPRGGGAGGRAQPWRGGAELGRWAGLCHRHQAGRPPGYQLSFSWF